MLAVKSRTYKRIGDVLTPLLRTYNLEIATNSSLDGDNAVKNGGNDFNNSASNNLVDIVTEDGARVDINNDVSTIENKKLFVQPQGCDKSNFLSLSKSDFNNTNETNCEHPEISLYEGLQIMRRGRFEDQRGTEIRFEIPDFLKLPNGSDKNAPNGGVKLNKDSIQMTPIKKEAFNDSSPTLGFV